MSENQAQRLKDTPGTGDRGGETRLSLYRHMPRPLGFAVPDHSGAASGLIGDRVATYPGEVIANTGQPGRGAGG